MSTCRVCSKVAQSVANVGQICLTPCGDLTHVGRVTRSRDLVTSTDTRVTAREKQAYTTVPGGYPVSAYILLYFDISNGFRAERLENL